MMTQVEKSHQSPLRGFTLIEILVVISILAVLSGIGLIGYLSTTRTQAEGFVRAEVNQLRKALLDYKNLNRVVITRGKDKDGNVWFDGYTEQSNPGNAKIIEALSSSNDKGEVAYAGINRTRLDSSGRLVDKWDTPYIFKVVFVRGKTGSMTIGSKTYADVSDVGVFSAGYDKQESISLPGNVWQEGEVDLTMPSSGSDYDLDNIYPTN